MAAPAASEQILVVQELLGPAGVPGRTFSPKRAHYPVVKSGASRCGSSTSGRYSRVASCLTWVSTGTASSLSRAKRQTQSAILRPTPRNGQQLFRCPLVRQRPEGRSQPEVALRVEGDVLEGETAKTEPGGALQIGLGPRRQAPGRTGRHGSHGSRGMLFACHT